LAIIKGYNTEWCKYILSPILSNPTMSPPYPSPLLITIFLGANDAVLSDIHPQYVPLNQYSENLKQMLKEIKTLHPNIRVILITPPPINERDWGNHRKSQNREMDRKLSVTKKYRDTCIEIGKMENIPTLDTWTLFLGPEGSTNWSNIEESTATFLIDGLHFNQKGNEILFEGIISFIESHWPDMIAEKMGSPLVWHDKVDKTNLIKSFFKSS